MADELSFRDLIRRVRAGEEEAAAQLVRRYEPTIRRIVSVRLRDARLRRLFDSQDVCQSVLGSFFVRAALGQYELERPEQLLRLLATMARNKLINQAHKYRAERRDHRRETAGSGTEEEVAATGSSPSQQVAAAELIKVARQQLSSKEQQLLELRKEGRTWAEIAAVLGGSPDGLRMQLARAVDRVTQQLGLDEVAHG